MIPRIHLGGVVAGVEAGNDRSACSGEPRTGYPRLCGAVISGPITAVGAWHNDRPRRPGLRELEDFTDLTEGSKTLWGARSLPVL